MATGYVLHQGATVLCMHGGQAQPATTSPRVKVSGQPVSIQTAPYLIAGCPVPPPPGGNGPCTTGMWVKAALRVRTNGIPVVLQDSQAVCVLPGTGLNVVSIQVRVKGE